MSIYIECLVTLFTFYIYIHDQIRNKNSNLIIYPVPLTGLEPVLAGLENQGFIH